MEQKQTNRIETAVLAWKEKEDRFKSVFSFEMATNKALMREKLRDYEKIAVRFGDTKDPDERFSLAALKQERKYIARKAYPNRLVRLFRQLVAGPIRRFVLERAKISLLRHNRLNVMAQLEKIGMSAQYKKVVQKMENGERSFTVPISTYVGESKRVDNNIVFEANGAGEYNLVTNKVQLQNQGDPQLNRQQTFKHSDGLNVDAEQSFNLLEGRAVQTDGKWVALDLNDRDTNGNYRIKEFPNSYGFDIKESLKELPISRLDKSQSDKILAELRKGKTHQVKMGTKNYTIEANPQFRTINIYDQSGQRVSKSEVSGKSVRKQKQEKLPAPKLVKRQGARVA